jgi:iron complex outermembrane receptor protein
MNLQSDLHRAALLAALLTALGPAQVRALDDEDDKIEIGRVDIRSLLDLSVEAVTRRPERASRAPASVFVLTGQDLRRHGFRTLGEALGAVPGLFGYPGVFQQVGVRGVGILGDFTTRLLVLVDGHALANSMGGDLGRGFPVPMAAVEKIEVIKGPVGAIYGPTAFLGVVNVVTRGAAPGSEVWAGFEAAQGSLRAGEVATTWRGRSGEAETLLSADASKTRGLAWTYPDVPPAAAGLPAGATSSGHDAGDALNGYLRARWRGLGLAGACGHTRTGLPVAATNTGLPDEVSKMGGLTCFAEATWEHRVSETITLKARGAFDHIEKGVTLAFPPPPDGIGHYWVGGHDQWTTGEVRAEWRPGDAFRLDGGATGQLHRVRQHSNSDLVPALEVVLGRRLQTLNTWLQAEARLGPTLTLSGGLTFFAHSLFGNQLTPKLAAVWQPGAADTVKAIWSTGFRPPTFVEALLQDRTTYLANPDLAPERVSSLELVYEHRFSDLASVSASLFRNQYRDLIRFAVVPAPGLGHPPDPGNPSDFRQVAQNLEAMDVSGGEVALTLRWREWLQGWAGLSLQQSDASARANFPGATASLALSSRAAWEPLLLTVRGTACAAREKAQDRLLPGQRSRVPATAVWAASAALDVPGAPGLQVELAVVNLLDTRAPSPADSSASPVSELPEGPRTVRADLRWRF